VRHVSARHSHGCGHKAARRGARVAQAARRHDGGRRAARRARCE
jgi:hypothetical protein